MAANFLVNEYRTVRVGDLLSDFRTLQYYIAAAPVNPSNMDDYYTEGWAALRQCSLDGQHILDCATELRPPSATGGEKEQEKAQLAMFVPPLPRPIASPSRRLRIHRENSGRIIEGPSGN